MILHFSVILDHYQLQVITKKSQ